MNIIAGPGTTEPHRRKWQGTCEKCGSTIEAIEGELTIHPEVIANEGHSPEYGTGMCPKCKVTIVRFFPLDKPR